MENNISKEESISSSRKFQQLSCKRDQRGEIKFLLYQNSHASSLSRPDKRDFNVNNFHGSRVKAGIVFINRARHMRAGEKDGIEPGQWLARQQTVSHRQFLPPRLKGVQCRAEETRASSTLSVRIFFFFFNFFTTKRGQVTRVTSVCENGGRKEGRKRGTVTEKGERECNRTDTRAQPSVSRLFHAYTYG